MNDEPFTQLMFGADPVVWRGLERLSIIGGMILFGYFGYRLYLFGIKEGKNELKVKSRWGSIVLSGIGPGLFFMAMAAIVLIVSLITGGASIEKTVNSEITKSGQTGPQNESNANDVKKQVVEIAARHLGKDVDQLTLGTFIRTTVRTKITLKGGDDKGGSEASPMVQEIERKLKVWVPVTDLERISTLGDLLQLLEERIRNRDEPKSVKK